MCVCVFVCLQAAEVEKQLSTQVHTLRDDFREKSISTNQHMTRLETQQAEVRTLSLSFDVSLYGKKHKWEVLII